MSTHQARTTERAVMWTIIALSGGLLGLLLTLGFGTDAWRWAAGVLFLGCIVTCTWAGVIGHRAERDVRQAIEDLADRRRTNG